MTGTDVSTEPRRVVVIQAGLGQPSSTRLLGERLAEATRDALLERGVESQVEVVELRDHAQALASTLLTGFATGELRAALDAVAAADAVIAVTPVYQGSFSGLFKTFVDVLDDGALRGTPVLLAATAEFPEEGIVLGDPGGVPEHDGAEWILADAYPLLEDIPKKYRTAVTAGRSVIERLAELAEPIGEIPVIAAPAPTASPAAPPATA